MLKVAMVTGAGSGIGKASALALAAGGHKVVLAGRRQAALDEVAAEIGSTGGEALAVATDVGDPDSVEALFKACGDTFGRLDVLFNNAGTGAPPVPMDELPISEWQRVVSANLNGAFYCTRLAFGMMRHQDPHGGQFQDTTCASCHRDTGFKGANLAFRHTDFERFRLTGAHAVVECTECHKAPADDRPVVFRGGGTTCGTCHEDPHAASVSD